MVENGDQPDAGLDRERPNDYGRSRTVSWATDVKNGRDSDNMVRIPPMCAILHRELLEQGWGWERVLPYRPGDVEWSEFKEYLVAYFNNTDKDNTLFGKLDPVGQSVVATEHCRLTAAVNLCVKVEKDLLATFFDDFALEDIFLSKQIRERAEQLTCSGCVSSAATAALLCITKEDELMYELLRRRVDTFEMVNFSNKVRRSASNLMLYKGSESDAAAAVLLGLAKEAELVLDALRKQHPYAYSEYMIGNTLREFTATALTKLEQELACQTAGTDSTVGDQTSHGDVNTHSGKSNTMTRNNNSDDKDGEESNNKTGTKVDN